MDCYVILAGGFWTLSKKEDCGGMQVDPKARESRSTVDYAIRINGLPDNMLQPIEIRRRTRYFCTLCNRYVTESEIEQKVGCYTAHKEHLRMEYKDVESWENGAVDRYTPVRQRWMKPCYRLFLNNNKGLDKWREIWRYIKAVYPPTKKLIPDLLPVAVGDRYQWTLQQDEVPVIELDTPTVSQTPVKPTIVTEWTVSTPVVNLSTAVNTTEKAAETPKPEESKAGIEFKCDICGKICKSAHGVFIHKKKAHKSV